MSALKPLDPTLYSLYFYYFYNGLICNCLPAELCPKLQNARECFCPRSFMRDRKGTGGTKPVTAHPRFVLGLAKETPEWFGAP